jgi:hypothetical protein
LFFLHELHFYHHHHHQPQTIYRFYKNKLIENSIATPISKMMKEERVLYIAAMRQPHHNHKDVEAFSSCLDGVDEDQVRRFAAHKLRNIKDVRVPMIV